MHPLKQFITLIDDADIWDATKSLSRGDYLKSGGSTDTNLYYVESGCLRAYTILEDREHTIRLGYRDNIIAALDSFLTGRPSAIYLQALKATKVRVLSRATFEHFLTLHERHRQLWTELLQLTIAELMEREQDLLIDDPAERYRRVLARSPQLFQEVPQKYIAAYLRMTPETLSRLKKS